MTDEIREPTAWMREQAGKRIRGTMRRMSQLHLDQIEQGVVVVLPMTEPPHADDAPGARLRWERSCDRCSEHVPLGALLITGQFDQHAPKGAAHFVITWGLCEGCAGKEGITRDDLSPFIDPLEDVGMAWLESLREKEQGNDQV